MLGPQAQRKSAFYFPRSKGSGLTNAEFMVPLFFTNFIHLSVAVGGLHCYLGFSLVAESGVTFQLQASHCSGIFCCRAQTLGQAGFRDCSSRALGHRLNGCGARAKLLRGRWDLSGSGIKLCLLHWQADSPSLRQQGSPHSNLIEREYCE